MATVLTPKHESLGPKARSVTQDALRLAETLGADTAILRAGADAAGELLRFAQSRNVTRVIIGRPRWRGPLLQWLMSLTREPVSEKLLDGAKNFETTLVTPNARVERCQAVFWRDFLPHEWRSSVASILSIAIATALAWPITLVDAIPSGAITVIYLMAVMLMGARFGISASLGP